MEQWIIQLIYIAASFLAVGLSSFLNWKSQVPNEAFNPYKFFSAYVRTAWALIPTALLFATQGLTVELLFGIIGITFGIDNSPKLVGNTATETMPQVEVPTEPTILPVTVTPVDPDARPIDMAFPAPPTP